MFSVFLAYLQINSKLCFFSAFFFFLFFFWGGGGVRRLSKLILWLFSSFVQSLCVTHNDDSVLMLIAVVYEYMYIYSCLL